MEAAYVQMLQIFTDFESDLATHSKKAVTGIFTTVEHHLFF